MATEADTSASKNATQSLQHHLRLHQPLMFYHADVTSSGLHNQKRGSQRDSDNNSVDKLISVDEFDDSDDEDNRSCSTVSPSPSDNTIIGGYSGSYNSGGGSNNNSHRLRKKGVIPSKVLDEQELQSLRLKINSRERKRMHDLNSALDGLREVMPYAHGPSVRKLSKIATLLLARNYILTLNSSLEEMKKLVNDIYNNPGSPSRRLGSQITSRSSAPSSVVVGCAGDGADTNTGSDSSATSLNCKSTTSTSKVSDTLPTFAHPSTNRISPLPAQQPVQPLLPLSIPALRTSLSGLSYHDISALTSACALPKCDSGNGQGISQTFPGQVHLLNRLPAPCACIQCLSGVSHFPSNLQFGRFSHPLFTSSAFLHRKN